MHLFNLLPSSPALSLGNYYMFKECFSADECEKIVKLAKGKFLHDGKIMGSHSVNPYRRSKICWIENDSSTKWIYDKLIPLIVEANTIWNFDLSAIVEHIQYSEYDASENGHYDYHYDLGDTSESKYRKVSIIVQLCDEKEYNGGDVNICTAFSKDVIIPKTKGTTVMFPSYLLHKVCPVTRGNRKSLVLWISGPPFR